MFSRSFLLNPNIKNQRFLKRVASKVLAPPRFPFPAQATRFLKTPPPKFASIRPCCISLMASRSALSVSTELLHRLNVLVLNNLSMSKLDAILSETVSLGVIVYQVEYLDKLDGSLRCGMGICE